MKKIKLSDFLIFPVILSYANLTQASDNLCSKALNTSIKTNKISLSQKATFKETHDVLVQSIHKAMAGEQVANIRFNSFQGPVLNQGNLGVCHLFSFASQFSHDASIRMNAPVEVSPFYWVYHHWLKEALEELKNDSNNNLDLELGSQFGKSLHLIRKVGAITKSGWAELGGKELNFSDKEHSLIESRLKKVIAESKTRERIIKSLFIDPLALLNDNKVRTNMDRSDIGNVYKKNLAYKSSIQNSTELRMMLSELIQENSPIVQDKEIFNLIRKAIEGYNVEREITANQLKKLDILLSKSSEQKIKEILDSYFFNPNTNFSASNARFSFNGRKNMSPQEFSKEYLPNLYNPTATIFLENRLVTENHKPVQINNPKSTDLKDLGDLVLSGSSDFIEYNLKFLLDHNNNVWIGYKHTSLAVDTSSGIMAMELLGTKPYPIALTRDEKNTLKTQDGGHAVQIVGYVLEPNSQKVKLWIVKNSWGTDHGDGGYYYMYNSYFRSQMSQMSFSLPAETNVILKFGQRDFLKRPTNSGFNNLNQPKDSSEE